METVTSKHGVPIRVPDERWAHIAEEHAELADRRADVLDTLRDPERILQGGAGEQLAVRQVEPGKWIVAVYKEQQTPQGTDGFLITAFLTRRIRSLERRTQLWP